MHFYFDGCNDVDFKKINKLGVIQGVTTNVSFAVSHGKLIGAKSYFESVNGIYKAFVETNEGKHFSVQALGNNADELSNSAIAIQEKFNQKVDLHIKIPVNYENLRVISDLTSQGIKVNATCITSFGQACMALQAGAKIVSFFWGKMTDEGISPKCHIRNTKRQIQDRALDAKILCGSIRQQMVITEIFESGADIITLTSGYFEKMANSKKSQEATSIFNNDWLQSGFTII